MTLNPGFEGRMCCCGGGDYDPHPGASRGCRGYSPITFISERNTIEDEGCRATPLHHWRRPEESDALSQRKGAKVDGGVVVGLGSSGFRIERQANEDFCAHFVL